MKEPLNLVDAIAIIHSLEAENKRLRDALEEIKSYGGYGYRQEFQYPEGYCPYGCDAPEIAKKALQGEKGGE